MNVNCYLNLFLIKILWLSFCLIFFSFQINPVDFIAGDYRG